MQPITFDASSFTKCCINYNGASLCRVNSPIRHFSGSSSFLYENGELFRRSEIKSTQSLCVIEKKEEPVNLIPFSFDQVVKPGKLYSINKKIVSRKIFSFFHSKLANKRFFFYTISFPLATSDSAAYALFNAVLTRLRKGYILSKIADVMLKKYSDSKSQKWLYAVSQMLKSTSFHKLNNYIWVAERQGNGTIHFHIITSDTLNVLVFNHFVAAYVFNSLQKHDNNVQISHLSQSQYNGVDVSKRRTGLSCVSDVRKYLTKYVTKNKTTFTHYAWHCSRSISALFTTIEFPVSAVVDKTLPISVDFKSEYYYISDYYTFIFYPSIDFDKVFCNLININNDIIDIFFSQ